MGKNRFDDDVTMLVIDIKSDEDTSKSENTKEVFSKNEVNRLIEYYKKSIQNKEEKGDTLGLIDNLKALGDKLTDQEKKDEASKVLNRAKDLSEKINDENRLANILTSLSILYYQKSDMDKSIDMAFYAEKIYKKHNNITNLANINNLISISYSRKGDNEKAKEYMIKALKLNKELDETRNNMRNRAIYYVNLGFTYGKESNMDKSLEYSLKAANIADSYGLIDLQPTLMNNIGDIYRMRADYEEALKYFHKGLQILEDISNKNLLGIILLNTSDIYLKNGEFELCLYYLKKAVYITQKYNLLYLESAVKSVRAYNYILADRVNDFISDLKDVIVLDEKLKFDPTQNFIRIPIAIFLKKYSLDDYQDMQDIIIKYYDGIENPKWYYETAVESTSKPMNTDFHIPSMYRYAQYLFEKGDKEKAMKFIKKAVDVCNQYQNYSEKIMIKNIISNWDIDIKID